MKDLKETLSIYFHGLKAAVAPTLSMPKERFAFVAAVWHYIFRLSGRLDRLITRWKNGTLPKPRPPASPHHASPHPAAPQPASPNPDSTCATPVGKPRFRLPGNYKWLLHRIQGTAFAGSQLAHLIATSAELHEFLEAAPQARRLLNPLCRALGIDFDRPTGVVLPKPQAAQEPTPQAAHGPTPEPAPHPPPDPARPDQAGSDQAGSVRSMSDSTGAAPDPPLVFSSA